MRGDRSAAARVSGTARVIRLNRVVGQPLTLNLGHVGADRLLQLANTHEWFGALAGLRIIWPFPQIDADIWG
jgi:hypothetical protein